MNSNRPPHAPPKQGPARLSLAAAGAGLLLLSAASMAFEVILTHLFSLVFQYHFSFLAVSMAVLGLGIGAVISFYLPALNEEQAGEWLSQSAAAAALILPAAVIIFSLTGFVPGILWQALLGALPFVLVGLLTTRLYTLFTRQAAWLYALDLAGSALGLGLALLLLDHISAASSGIALGLAAALALLVGAFLLRKAFSRLGYDKDLAYSLVLWATVWGFVAAKIYYLLANLDHFSWHMLGGSGFVWYGGLIGGVLAVVVITRRHKLPLGVVAGAMAMPLSVAYGIGRIGCFLAGDGTQGQPTDLPWGIAFPHGAVPVDVRVRPTQLYEALVAFVIAAILSWLGRRWQPVSVFGAYLVLSGLARLLVEFVRINPPALLGLTEAQLFGIASMVAGGLLIIHDRRSQPATTDVSPTLTATGVGLP